MQVILPDEQIHQLQLLISQLIENEIKKRVGITTKVKIHAQDSLPKCEGGKINRILKK